MSDLPIFAPLSDHELTELFGDDLRALRRYQILRSLLIDARTQREAARLHGVSERTIRNVIGAFTRDPRLEMLRSRPPGARRRDDRRRLGFEPALSAALSEDPQAGGDRLWRRAQELLGEAGAGLSRRTAYRLLSGLRSGATRPEHALGDLVRAALPLLPEDPPLALGASGLARRLLPNESDPLLRGALLQQALRNALDRLRPEGEITTIDRSWWPYLICTGEFEACQSRAELQDDLALSPSTYTRAKRQGLQRITAMLPALVAQIEENPATLVARRLPRAPGFLGRHDEQAYYAWRLQAEGRAYLWGLPGSGKSALAAELAAEGQRYGQTVIWHTCRPGRDATHAGLLRGLAEALATTGDTQLWQVLRQPSAERPPDGDLVELLGERLASHPAVVVIDDVHRAEPETEPIFTLLDQLARRGALRLLLVSRLRPENSDWPALPGLSEAEARLLWRSASTLTIEQWQELYTATAGLPRPIAIAAAACRRSVGRPLRREWLDAVESWAQDAIWGRLNRSERRLLAAICIRATSGSRLCEAIGEPEQALTELFRRGLAESEGAPPAIVGALRRGALELLRSDAELRAALADHTAPPQPQEYDASVPATPAPTPGIELLERLRTALDRSSSYLQSHGSDRDARMIARELRQLRAALPDPHGPRY